MRNPVTTKEPRREGLVVGREQRSGVVQHDDASGRKRAEGLQAVVHSVERRQHVEPPERDVARA